MYQLLFAILSLFFAAPTAHLMRHDEKKAIYLKKPLPRSKKSSSQLAKTVSDDENKKFVNIYASKLPIRRQKSIKKHHKDSDSLSALFDHMSLHDDDFSADENDNLYEQEDDRVSGDSSLYENEVEIISEDDSDDESEEYTDSEEFSYSQNDEVEHREQVEVKKNNQTLRVTFIFSEDSDEINESTKNLRQKHFMIQKSKKKPKDENPRSYRNRRRPRN